MTVVVDVPVLPPAGAQIASLPRLPYWPSALGPDPAGVGGFLFGKVFDIRLCMFPSCSHCFTGLRTYFVFSVAQLLPMVIVFFGFNGNFNGKMTKINKMAKNHFSGVQNGSQSV